MTSCGRMKITTTGGFIISYLEHQIITGGFRVKVVQIFCLKLAGF